MGRRLAPSQNETARVTQAQLTRRAPERVCSKRTPKGERETVAWPLLFRGFRGGWRFVFTQKVT